MLSSRRCLWWWATWLLHLFRSWHFMRPKMWRHLWLSLLRWRKHPHLQHRFSRICKARKNWNSRFKILFRNFALPCRGKSRTRWRFNYGGMWWRNNSNRGISRFLRNPGLDRSGRPVLLGGETGLLYFNGGSGRRGRTFRPVR